jgi:hypothetical protein
MADNFPSNIRDRLKAALSQLFNFKKANLFAHIDDFQLEKRAYQRNKHFTEVCYADNRRSVIGFIQNISAGGLSIEPVGPFFEGQEITLTFKPPSGRGHVKISGKIVRKDHKGIGVQFTNKIENML